MSGKLILTCRDGRRVAWTGAGFVLHPFSAWACVSTSRSAQVGIASSLPRTAAVDYFMWLSQPSRINLTYLLMTATRGWLGCPVLIYWPRLNVDESMVILCSNLQGDLPRCVAEMRYFLSSVSGKIAPLYKQSLGIVCSTTPSFHVVFTEFTSQNTSAHSSAL